MPIERQNPSRKQTSALVYPFVHGLNWSFTCDKYRARAADLGADTVIVTHSTPVNIATYPSVEGQVSLNPNDGAWSSTHPSGQGTNVTVYGPGEDQEHWIPLFAITNRDLQTGWLRRFDEAK